MRVIDLGHYIAGPLAALLLADHGADVTAVHPPGGRRWQHPAAVGLDHGKQTVALDLSVAAGVAKVQRLIADADVVVENFRPGTMARWGMDPVRLRRENPKLIWLSLPGFASTDADRADLPGWDGVVGAATGLFTDMNPIRALLGLPPTWTALPLPSVYAGVHGAVAVVMSLLGRERGGEGTTLEVSLAGAMASAVGGLAMAVEPHPARYDTPPLPPAVQKILPTIRRALGGAPSAVQNGVAGVMRAAIPPFMDSYRCADDRLLYVFAVDHARLSERLLEVTGVRGRLDGLTTTDPYAATRDDNLSDVTSLAPLRRLKIRRLLTEAFATAPAESWERRLNEARVPCTIQQTTARWLSSPQPRDAGLLRDVELDGRRTLMPGKAVWIAQSPGSGRALGPLPNDSDDLPLTGGRVVDLSTMVAGPACARTLGEYGADVIKIDQPKPLHGPRLSCWFPIELSQGKRSALLDLRADGTRAALSHADVVVDNIRPDALAGLGVDHRTLAEGNPDVVSCSISAFGGPDGGPWADRPGYDPVLQAATGVMLRFGTGKPELHAIASCVDYLTGYLGAFGVGLALLAQARGHGRNAHVQTSLASAAQLAQLPFMLASPDATPVQNDQADGRVGLGSAPHQRLYRTRDGWLYLGARADQLGAIRAAIGADGPSHEDFERALARSSVVEAVSRVRRAGAAAHRVDTVNALRKAALRADDEDSFAARRDARHPAGATVELLSPTYVRSDRWRLRAGRPAPAPGSDTREILAEAGLDPATIEDLVADGAASDRLSDGYLPA